MMRKLLCVLMCFMTCACATQTTEETVESITYEKPTHTSTPAPTPITDPWIVADSFEEMVEGSGLKFTELTDVMLEGYEPVQYRYGDQMLEITYQNGDSTMIIRKAKSASEDISGDFNPYGSEWETTLTDYDVVVHGKGGWTYANVLSWVAGDYSFSIDTNPGQSGKGANFNEIVDAVIQMVADEVPSKSEDEETEAETTAEPETNAETNG